MNKDKRELLAGYIDGELSERELREFEQQLEHNPQLRAELEEFKKLKEVTGMVQYADLPIEVWENYWQNLYRKLERGIGWILFSIGAIAILSFGLVQLFGALYLNPKIPTAIQIGVTVLGIGVVILFVSFIRERFFAYNRDRYRKVIR